MTKKILIADDDPAILESIQMILEDAGYDVITTANDETVIKMQKEVPGLLLLDIWMSGQNGQDICRQLKSQKATSHIPIIMISANRDTKQIAKESGADDFLAKPFDMQELLDKVKKYIN